MQPLSLSAADALDVADPLRHARTLFALPADTIYLDGNSLGPLPRATPARLAAIVEQEWGQRLIGSWNEAGWWEAPVRIGDKIGQLIGVGPGTVVATDTTSANLNKLVAAVVQSRPGAILVETDNFPTDAYVAQSVARQFGRELRMVEGGRLPEALTADIAVAIVTQVNYRTAARADVAALEAVARAAKVQIVWDLSHSIGAVPLSLARDGATLAVGCGYKYLNGGPGAPAWLYVAGELQAELASPVVGWWGHAEPFLFGADWKPANGIRRFLGGTQPMLSLLALEVGVDLVLGFAMNDIWAKSQRLFDLFADRAAALCPELALVSPRDANRRGSHISFAHPHAYRIIQALIERGVVGDYRAPDIARFGLTPLTLSYADVWHATEHLAEVMTTAAWQDPRFERYRAVT